VTVAELPIAGATYYPAPPEGALTAGSPGLHGSILYLAPGHCRVAVEYEHAGSRHCLGFLAPNRVVSGYISRGTPLIARLMEFRTAGPTLKLIARAEVLADVGDVYDVGDRLTAAHLPPEGVRLSVAQSICCGELGGIHRISWTEEIHPPLYADSRISSPNFTGQPGTVLFLRPDGDKISAVEVRD
jgi:hypothetical protein